MSTRQWVETAAYILRMRFEGFTGYPKIDRMTLIYAIVELRRLKTLLPQ